MYLSGEGVLTPSSMYFMFEGGRSTALANSRKLNSCFSRNFRIVFPSFCFAFLPRYGLFQLISSVHLLPCMCSVFCNIEQYYHIGLYKVKIFVDSDYKNLWILTKNPVNNCAQGLLMVLGAYCYFSLTISYPEQPRRTWYRLSSIQYVVLSAAPSFVAIFVQIRLEISFVPPNAMGRIW